MVLAQAIGVTRFILGFIYPAQPCGSKDERPIFIKGLHPYYYNIIQVCVAFILAYIISITDKPIPKEKVVQFKTIRRVCIIDKIYSSNVSLILNCIFFVVQLAGLTFWTRFDKPHYAAEEEKHALEEAVVEAARRREELESGKPDYNGFSIMSLYCVL